MATPENEQPATRDDVRRVALEAADQSQELRATLALELRRLDRTLREDARAEALHVAEVVRGELKLIRRELDERAHYQADAIETAGASLATRLTVLSAVAHLASIATIVVILTVLA